METDDELLQQEISEYASSANGIGNPGIEFFAGIPYEHEQIGLVEKRHQTYQEMVVKTLVNKPHLSQSYWVMSYLHAESVYNTYPSGEGLLTSPYERWYKRKFDLNSTPLIPFGAIVLAHTPLQLQQGALGPRSFETYCVGVAEGYKGGETTA